MQSLAYWFRRLFWTVSYKDRSGGIPVGTFLAFAEQKERHIPKVTAALDLIRRVEPHRYQRMLRNVRAIHLLGTRYYALGAWYAPLRMIDLAEDWVEDPNTSPEDIAATLVHEATHARLTQFGYSEALRARVERICHYQEAVFASRLGNGEQLVAAARRAMDRDGASYSSATRRTDRLKALRALGMPSWFVQLVDWLTHWRAA